MLPSLAWLSRPICLPPYFAGCTERSARWPCFIFANSQVSCTVINVHGGQRLPRAPVNNGKQGDTLALRREPVEHRAPGNTTTETLNRSEKAAPLNRKAPRDRQLRKRSWRDALTRSTHSAAIISKRYEWYECKSGIVHRYRREFCIPELTVLRGSRNHFQKENKDGKLVQSGRRKTVRNSPKTQ